MDARGAALSAAAASIAFTNRNKSDISLCVKSMECEIYVTLAIDDRIRPLSIASGGRPTKRNVKRLPGGTRKAPVGLPRGSWLRPGPLAVALARIGRSYFEVTLPIRLAAGARRTGRAANQAPAMRTRDPRKIQKPVQFMASCPAYM